MWARHNGRYILLDEETTCSKRHRATSWENTWSLIQFKDLPITHVSIGSSLVISVVLQAVIGHRHHIRFRQTGCRTKLSHIHVYLGRLILILGFLNTALYVVPWFGLQLVLTMIRGASTSYFEGRQLTTYTTVAVLCVAWTLLYIFIRQPEHKSAEKSYNYEMIPTRVG